MANRKQFSTAKPTHGTRLPMPMSARQPVKPAAPAGVIAPMVSEAQDGETAGSRGVSPPARPSNGLLGPYRDALVPPHGTQVP